MKSRDLAFCGLFGAVALLLPILFHVLQLGRVFMPMYLPLMALAFYVAPTAAALTALVVPVLSGLLTGMPPFMPPVAVVMSLELALMAALASWLYRALPQWSALAVLLPVLLFGRFVGAGLMYGAALLLDLPEKVVAGISLLSGWPGLVLMLVVIPPLVRLTMNQTRRRQRDNYGG